MIALMNHYSPYFNKVFKIYITWASNRAKKNNEFPFINSIKSYNFQVLKQNKNISEKHFD